MELKEFLEKMDTGEEIEAGSEYHMLMHGLSQEALRITAEMNNAYHTPEELVELMRKLTGQPDFPTFGPFPTVLYGLRKEHPFRAKRVSQFRLPVSGSGRHMDRG